MTRIVAGATHDRNGVRVCPLGCSGVDRGPGVPVGCVKAKRKTMVIEVSPSDIATGHVTRLPDEHVYLSEELGL